MSEYVRTVLVGLSSVVFSSTLLYYSRIGPEIAKGHLNRSLVFSLFCVTFAARLDTDVFRTQMALSSGMVVGFFPQLLHFP